MLGKLEKILCKVKLRNPVEGHLYARARRMLGVFKKTYILSLCGGLSRFLQVLYKASLRIRGYRLKWSL